MLSLIELNLKNIIISSWYPNLKNSIILSENRSSSDEPYKFIYESIKIVKSLRLDVQNFLANISSTEATIYINFWTNFILIHINSAIAKWSEASDELSNAEDWHLQCLELIKKLLKYEEEIQLLDYKEDEDIKIKSELIHGVSRTRYMYLNELTRYAILCSERDNQDKAFELLVQAEKFYHDNIFENIDISSEECPILAKLDQLNSEKSSDMFIYVLFYLGQAYQIKSEKEKAVLYLHMVLRKQLEKGDYSKLTWCSDTIRMSGVVLVNIQCYETSKTLLLAAKYVLENSTDEEKLKDEFKQTYAELGKAWLKLGLDLLEVSCDRLKDLEEQTRKPPEFKKSLKLTDYEIKSLELPTTNNEFDTHVLIKSLNFPSLNLEEAKKNEMTGKYSRDFDEAKKIFLPLQKWFRSAKEYYNINEYAGDYIELVTDYCNSFKYLAFFEPNVEMQIRLHKRRVAIFEELLSSLSPTAFCDIFHYTLKDLAEIYENIYKLKILKAKEEGKNIRFKDLKLVKILCNAVGAHKRNLSNFHFDLEKPTQSFPPDYEKTILGTVLSTGRILASISHDHPLHPDALLLAKDSKKYYEYFIKYLDVHPALKADFQTLYDSTHDLPSLIDTQITKIQQITRNLSIS